MVGCGPGPRAQRFVFVLDLLAFISGCLSQSQLVQIPLCTAYDDLQREPPASNVRWWRSSRYAFHGALRSAREK
jgi:hypothetical protein